jgi:hypothetical protein
MGEKNVTDSIPHDFEYDFEHGLWLCVRCTYSTPSRQIYHYGCAPVVSTRALTASREPTADG